MTGAAIAVQPLARVEVVVAAETIALAEAEEAMVAAEKTAPAASTIDAVVVPVPATIAPDAFTASPPAQKFSKEQWREFLNFTPSSTVSCVTQRRTTSLRNPTRSFQVRLSRKRGFERA